MHSMKKFFLFSILLSLFFCDVSAQFYSTQYRAPGENWQQLRTDRFRVIYPERYRDIAVRSLSILELEYDDIQELVGGELRNFPVILNPGNDRSNGFVAPFNFRSEVEIAPFLGKGLNPKSGDWLETVLPHELVHALHFSVNPPSVMRPVGLFSPDIRRSVHAAAPLGFLEGIAVQHETHNTMPGAGRGHYSFFNNQFNAMQGADQPWSMGQLVHTTTFTPPFNRHYIGGYRFVHWLQETYGEDTMQRTIRRHYKLPFLGFGFSLRTTTGQWPGSLYRDFMEEQDEQHESSLEQISKDTDSLSEQIPFNAACRRASRPLWLSDSLILFYGRSCNQPTGFYLHDLSTGKTSLFHEVSITGDHHYTLTPDGNSLIYARFHPSPLYDNRFQADLHRLDLASGKSERITKKQRMIAPAFWGDTLLAAQTSGESLILAAADRQTGEIIRRFSQDDNSSLISLAPHPTDEHLTAVAGRKNGVQAIWLEDLHTDPILFERTPDIVFDNGSIFDPAWNSDGSRLLFTADRNDGMNLYEFNPETGNMQQLTDARYIAMEGSVSPNGNQVAYISQRKNEQLPVLLNYSAALGEELPPGEWTAGTATEQMLGRNLLNRQEEADPSGWSESSYKTGLGWIKPRIWLPVAESIVDDYDQLGVSLESTDRLSRHAYSLEVTHFKKTFWFDGTYRYTGRYPGFELDLFNRPSINTFRIDQEGSESTFFRTVTQRRGGTLAVPFRYRIEQNTRFSSFLIEPEFSVFQTRFNAFNDASESISEFSDPQYTPGLNTVLSLGLRQHTRDLQPNRGIQFYTQTRYGLNSSPFTIQTPAGEASNIFSRRRGFRAGLNWFVAPLLRYNQSLRISAQAFTQTTAPVFDVQSVISNLFDPVAAPGAENTGIFETRYTIPLIYPDDGGLLLPVYLSNIYIVLFSQTVTDLDRVNTETRTILGTGLRSRFKVGNLLLDVGIAVGWEPGRNRVDALIGNF